MKLLLCIECSDIRALGLEPVSCRCGRATASLRPGTNPKAKPIVHASDHALIVGVEDSSLRTALVRKTERPSEAQMLTVFILPEPCKTVERVRAAKR